MGRKAVGGTAGPDAIHPQVLAMLRNEPAPEALDVAAAEAVKAAILLAYPTKVALPHGRGLSPLPAGVRRSGLRWETARAWSAVAGRTLRGETDGTDD